MEEYLSIGGKLFHKYLGVIIVKEVVNKNIIADTGSRGVLAFAFYDFGKVLFLDKEHAMRSFDTYDEYITFCEEDKRIKDESEERASQEHERLRIKEIQEAVKEKEIELEKARLLEENKRLESQRRRESLRIEQELAELQIKCESELKTKLIENLREKYKYEGFHHYTDITNLYKIIKTGKLLSRNRAIELGFTDAADHNVLSHTNYHIMNYVRFFYKEKTPTIYKNEGIKLDNSNPHMPIPVLLLFDEKIIQHPEVAYLSGGGGNPNSIFTRDISTALNFDWCVIFYRGPIPRYDNEIPSIGNDSSGASITNKKNAEFLYPTEIDTKYIRKIIFRAPADKKMAEEILGRNDLFFVDYDRLKFNYNNNFLYDYEIVPQCNDFLIALRFDRDFEEYHHELCIYYLDNTTEKLNISKLPFSRKTDMQKPLEYESFGYYFIIRTLRNMRATKVEYLLNGHLSALWEERRI